MMDPRLAMVARRFGKKFVMSKAQSKAFRYKRMVAGTNYDRYLVVRQERKVVRSHEERGSSECDGRLDREDAVSSVPRNPRSKRRLKVS